MLTTSFFAHPTQYVAQELIGATLVYDDKQIMITETEAYIGKDDPACHAAKGRTKRTEVMFGRAGLIYVYLIYGMYHCLNIVTEEEGFPAAVLIRGGKDFSSPHVKLDGPGKLCRYLALTRDDNFKDATDGSHLYFLPREQDYSIKTTPRIGIREGTDKLWRYVLA